MSKYFVDNLLKKKDRYLNGDDKFYCCKGNLISDLAIHWSLLLLGNKPKKFDFVHQTVSRWEARAGWSQD